MISTPTTRKYVRGACERCRRQKLKCDVQRPCTMCRRAGVDCIGPVGKKNSRKPIARSIQRSPDVAPSVPSPDDTIVVPPTQPSPPESLERSPEATLDRAIGLQVDKSTTGGQTEIVNERVEVQLDSGGTSTLGSSATMDFVETGLLYEDAARPTGDSASGPASQFSYASPGDGPTSGASLALTDVYPPTAINGPVQRGRRPRRPTNLRLQQRLIKVIPNREATNLLVDTYFDRAHWFMLVFYQEDFRQQLERLYRGPQAPQDGKTTSVGFLAVLLPVICIGLQYVGKYREGLLSRYGVNKDILQNSIIATLEESFLAIVSLGSLEAVQACVLLGTFYLYHSDSATAWSVCGCALRIAQAIKLHRRWPALEGEQSNLSDEIRRQVSARKRCWWALYEVEAFCCMLHGYTCSILDADCDMEYLFHHDDHTIEGISDQGTTLPFTLLSYKANMSKLSVILKSALSELYGHWAGSRNETDGTSSISGARHQLFTSIKNLDNRLTLWYTELPLQLRITSLGHSGYDNVDQSERDIGGSGRTFDNNIIQLQALALELAFENAKILIHRPLLTHRLKKVQLPLNDSGTTPVNHQFISNKLQESFEKCRQAALRTAEIGDYPAFKFVFRSFAAAFMSTHLFTAGVTLCLSAMTDPLTEQATKAKVGLQKLFNLQNDPVSEPLASPHMTKVLERLIRVVLEKELICILGPQRQGLQNSGATRQPTPSIRADAAGNSISEGHETEPTTSAFSQIPLSRIDIDESLQNTPGCGKDTTNPVSQSGHPELMEAVEFGPNVPLLFPPDQAQFNPADDFFSMANDPLFSDQEQAWMWNLDQCLQL